MLINLKILLPTRQVGGTRVSASIMCNYGALFAYNKQNIICVSVFCQSRMNIKHKQTVILMIMGPPSVKSKLQCNIEQQETDLTA